MSPSSSHPRDEVDVLVIGAGPAGLYALYLLRQRGLRVRALEAGSGVGGTWFWNRYPGARLHSESHSYQYFFDQELLEEWDWTELFAGQPELERYYNRVADKHDLRRDIEFETTVESLTFDETTDRWVVGTHGESRTGRTLTARVVLSATGPLSAPIYLDVPGQETFAGESFHTARWPDRDVSVAGRRVIVVGTGSTGVQVIPQIAREAERLTVFMRTPNWVIPLNNRPLDAVEMAELRRGYPELHKYLSGTFGGFLHDPDPTPTTAYSPEELLARYDSGWRASGFAKWFGMPYDILSDEAINKHYSDFVAAKIRARVDDPALAELLIPSHPFGSKPVECESASYVVDGVAEGTGYYEVYNRDNVELISVAQDPIVAVVPEGVRTRDRLIEADLIVYATGFEAFVGSLNRIEVTGLGGQRLRDRWADGPVTFLGMAMSGFPNLFMVGGPHGKGGHGNSTRCAEAPLEWIANLSEKIVREDLRRVEPTKDAEDAWTSHVLEVGNASMVSKARSFLFGDNLPGAPGRKRSYVAYIGALPEFVERLRRIEADDYEGFDITR